MFGTDLRLSFSSVFHSVSRAAHGDTDVHAEDAHIRVVLYTRYFNMFLYAESEITLFVKRRARDFIINNGQNFLQKINCPLFSQRHNTRYWLAPPYPKDSYGFLGFFFYWRLFFSLPHHLRSFLLRLR